MPFQIVHSDMLSIHCDAIVNPTDELLSGSGGLDAQIHMAVGSKMDQECQMYIPLRTGSAALTQAHNLNCRYVIHTATPWWTGRQEQIELLRLCYKNALKIVSECELYSTAFPLIGGGTRGFPRDLVLKIAAEEIQDYLFQRDDLFVYLVVHDMAEFQPNPDLLYGLEEYIYYLHEKERRENEVHSMLETASTGAFPAITLEEIEAARHEEDASQHSRPPAPASSLKRPGRFFGTPFHKKQPKSTFEPQTALGSSNEKPGLVVPFGSFQPERGAILDESFAQMVLRKVDEKGYKKDSDCYSKANIDRRLFSRLRCDEDYHPKKTTAVALAIALELSISETNELLMKAGYSLSHSITFDVIIEYCILQHNYNIFEINELLFQYDQPLLGG